MRTPRIPRIAAVAAGIVVASSCASTPSRPLSDTLPLGLPSVSARATWERIDGDYETATDHVRYALFVDPDLPLLFRITHYRVTRRPGTPGPARSGDGAETVIWNANPGLRGPLRCFTEDPPAPPSPRPNRTAWRDVDPGTTEFRANMHRAIEIYERVRREGRAGPKVR